MTCDDAKEGLSALLDGALDPAEQPAVEAHAASCAACRTYRDEIGGVRALLRSVDDADDPPARSATLGKDVVRAIGSRRRGRQVSLFAAVIVVVVMAGAVVRDCVVIHRRNASQEQAAAPPQPVKPLTPEAIPAPQQIEGHLVAEAEDAATRDALRELFRSWPGTISAKNAGEFGLDVEFKGPSGDGARKFAGMLEEFRSAHSFSAWNYSESRR